MDTIKRGDAYGVPIELKLNGETIAESNLAAVEVYFGETRYLYPQDMQYADGAVIVPLTQEQTFALQAGAKVAVDVRVKLTNGEVHGIPEKIYATIADAKSGVVL